MRSQGPNMRALVMQRRHRWQGERQKKLTPVNKTIDQHMCNRFGYVLLLFSAQLREVSDTTSLGEHKPFYAKFY